MEEDIKKPNEIEQESEHKESQTRPEWQEAMLRTFLAGH